MMRFIQILLLILLLTNFATATYIIESSEETFLDSILAWFSNFGNLITGFAAGGDKSGENMAEVGDVVTLKTEEIVSYSDVNLKLQLLGSDGSSAALQNLVTGKDLGLERGIPNEDPVVDILFIKGTINELVFSTGEANYPPEGDKNPVVYTTPGNSFLIKKGWTFKISDKAIFVFKDIVGDKIILSGLEGQELTLAVDDQPQEFQSLKYTLLSIDPTIINVEEVSACKQGEVLIARGELDGSVVYQCVEVPINVDISKIPAGCAVPVCSSNLKVVGQEASGCLSFECENNPSCESVPPCTGGEYKLTKVSGECLTYECVGGCEEPPVCDGVLSIKSWEGDCPIYDCEVQETKCVVPYCEGTLKVVGTDTDGCSIYECQPIDTEFSLDCPQVECSGTLIDTGAVDALGCIVYACQELLVESGELTLEISLATGELPNENVQVYILNENWGVIEKSFTDSSGKANFAFLPGTYIVMVDDEQFLLSQEKITLEKNTVLEIVLEPSAMAPCPVVQQPLLQAGCIAIPVKDGACIIDFDISCPESTETTSEEIEEPEVEPTKVISIKPKITEHRSVEIVELMETVQEALVEETCEPVCTALCGGSDGCGGQCSDNNVNKPGFCGNPSAEEIESEPELVTGTSNAITTFFNFLFG